jgi:hypothetical protein
VGGNAAAVFHRGYDDLVPGRSRALQRVGSLPVFAQWRSFTLASGRWCSRIASARGNVRSDHARGARSPELPRRLRRWHLRHASNKMRSNTSSQGSFRWSNRAVRQRGSWQHLSILSPATPARYGLGRCPACARQQWRRAQQCGSSLVGRSPRQGVATVPCHW